MPVDNKDLDRIKKVGNKLKFKMDREVTSHEIDLRIAAVERRIKRVNACDCVERKKKLKARKKKLEALKAEVE